MDGLLRAVFGRRVGFRRGGELQRLLATRRGRRGRSVPLVRRRTFSRRARSRRSATRGRSPRGDSVHGPRVGLENGPPRGRRGDGGQHRGGVSSRCPPPRVTDAGAQEVLVPDDEEPGGVQAQHEQQPGREHGGVDEGGRRAHGRGPGRDGGRMSRRRRDVRTHVRRRGGTVTIVAEEENGGEEGRGGVAGRGGKKRRGRREATEEEVVVVVGVEVGTGRGRGEILFFGHRSAGPTRHR